MVIRKPLATLASLAALATAAPAGAVPNPLFFDFDTVDSFASVQAYVNSVAGAGNVTVLGGYKEHTYTGDKYVVRTSGSAGSSNYLDYLTLGTSDGAISSIDVAHKSARTTDWFITNKGVSTNTNTPYGTAGNDKIVFIFKDPIYNISFDWEVFPNATCTSCAPGGSNYPDFKLWVGNGSLLYTFGAADFPVSSPTYNGTSFLPQGLGHFSATFDKPVTRVEFVDWPVKIGIDNLDPQQVPEPGSLALLGVGLAALALRRRRRTV